MKDMNFERLIELTQRVMFYRARSIACILGDGFVFEDETLRITRRSYQNDIYSKEEMVIFSKDTQRVLYDSVYEEGQLQVLTYLPGKWEAQFRGLYAESLERRASSEFLQKKMKFPRRTG